MSSPRPTSNPFDLTKASDFSDEQIIQYWVDFAGEERLEALFKPRLKMPMLLLGGKGSGKTHLMRYFSSAVQKIRFNGSLLTAVQNEKHLGVYMRADGLNVGRFCEKGQSDERWAAVFGYYFELWMASQLLRNLQDCISEESISFNEEGFVSSALDLFVSENTPSLTKISELIAFFSKLRKKIDHTVGNCAISKDLSPIDIATVPGSLAFDLPDLINQHTDGFRDVLFVYMIDEIENFTEIQQKFLNTLIRYRRGPVSLKIGARLYGLRTKSTLGAGEEIKKDAEYDVIELDAWLRDNSDAYRALASRLLIRRLEQEHLISADKINGYKLEEQFEILDSANNYSAPLNALVAKYEGKERPYFSNLADVIRKISGKAESKETDKYISNIIDSLRVPDSPLLEKVNIYLLYKGWPKYSEIGACAAAIGEKAKLFISGGRGSSPEYFQTLDHFKSDFLAQIYKDCGKQRVVYAGLDTLIHLSQGIPRNLLSLLKSIYRRSLFAGERPFQAGSKISINSQIEGVRDGSAWFWNDAQPDKHGTEVREAVESLAELFRRVRYSLKPSECDLGTFTVNTKAGTSDAKEVLKHAENWSYLIRVSDGGVNRNNSAAIDEKFQLSPMLAPRWEISEHRRGSIQLQEPLFDAIFDPAFYARLPDLLTERLRGMEEPYTTGPKNNSQNELF